MINTLAWALGGLLGVMLFTGLKAAFATLKLQDAPPRLATGLSGRLLAKYSHHPERLFFTLELGRVLGIVVLLFGLLRAIPVFPYATTPFGSELAVWLVAIGLLLVAGEYLPNLLFRRFAETLTFVLAPLVEFFYWLFTPFTWAFERLARVVLQALPAHRDSRPALPLPISNDLNEFRERFFSEDVSQNSELDTEVFTNAMDFDKVRVRDFMVPRTEIVALPQSTTLTLLRERFIETELSRILIYNESLDEVLGFVHSLALFAAPTAISEILQPVLTVPESMAANTLLAEFNVKHRSLAIVVDEFGGTSGLVSVEDLVETVFGEIEDEHDEEEQDPQFVKIRVAEHTYHFSARLDIAYLNTKYGLSLPEEDDYSTLGGLVLHIAEHIPETGEHFHAGAYSLKVLQAARNKIDLIELTVTTSED